ncbi:WGR domain-containing protein [Gymnodinialimonas sp. 2305UL16-5]|uniref:WGR domain-containing protein n=1 Tax=Gymnodinialimonas mytili TaxID=3126503 RepID=UPI00309C5B2F
MHLTGVEPEDNVNRFYRMEIGRGLFREWGLVREWGRIGRSGTLRTDWFSTEIEAKDARYKLQMQKAKRGYEF